MLVASLPSASMQRPHLNVSLHKAHVPETLQHQPPRRLLNRRPPVSARRNAAQRDRLHSEREVVDGARLRREGAAGGEGPGNVRRIAAKLSAWVMRGRGVREACGVRAPLAGKVRVMSAV